MPRTAFELHYDTYPEVLMTQGTPRLEPVTDPTEEQAGLLGKTLLTPDAEPLNLFTTLAHHPLLMKRVNALGGVFMAHGSLRPRERELVILRVARRVGSEYEAAQHRAIARRIGMSEDEIERISADSIANWNRCDQLLLRAADELCSSDDLSDETWTGLSSAWRPEQLLELIVMIGFYRMLGGVLRGLRVQIDASVAEG